MKHPCVFTADIHGIERQYQKLVDFTVARKARSLIIGGDIAPRGRNPEYLMYEQRGFISEKLPGILQMLQKKSPDCRVYLIMGNDDCACNMDVLEVNEELFHVIHGRRLKLTMDFEIVGYSHVPITPFTVKDWEKFDLSEVPSHLRSVYVRRKMLNYRTYGVISARGTLHSYPINLS